MDQRTRRIRKAATHWGELVLVCRKCSKKVHGGFGPRQRTRLDKALRDSLGIAKGRRGTVGFVRVPCFGLCPKNAVTVALGSAPGALLVVPRGMPVDDVAEALGLAGKADEDSA